MSPTKSTLQAPLSVTLQVALGVADGLNDSICGWQHPKYGDRTQGAIADSVDLLLASLSAGREMIDILSADRSSAAVDRSVGVVCWLIRDIVTSQVLCRRLGCQPMGSSSSNALSALAGGCTVPAQSSPVWFGQTPHREVRAEVDRRRRIG